MPILKDFSEFDGRHWETGSVANVLAYQWTGTEPMLDEAMMLGLSGGAAFGYFVFDYKNTDPHVALLSRNTFDPLETLLGRLAIPQDLLQTASPDKAQANLIEILESGRPAIVWADMFSLPYNALPQGEHMWATNPIVVYGYRDGLAHIADRSSQPVTIPAGTLARARARIKADRFRVLGLGQPNLDRLPDAIRASIRQCIALYREKPPKGSASNFGFAAFEKWAAMLTNKRNKSSWERLLPPGPRMYAALAGSGYQPGAFGWARTYSSNQVDDRAMYATFLDRACEILGVSTLADAADGFRASSEAWRQLSEILLPENVTLLHDTRKLLLSRRRIWVCDGQSAQDEIEELNSQLESLRRSAQDAFPLSSSEAAVVRERIADGVMGIRALEETAIQCLERSLPRDGT